MRKMTLAFIAFGCFFVFAGVSGCAATNQNTPTQGTNTTVINTQVPSQPATTQVSIKSNLFVPATITVKAGQTVTWINNDSYIHTVDSTAANFHSNDLKTGETFSFTFTQAGTFSYTCGVHPFMKGTVVVTQ